MSRTRPEKKPRRRLTPEARREELLEALSAVLAEHGYAGTTVPRIVARAGAAQGSFYRYFRDVDDAFLTLARRVIAPLASAAFELDLSDARSAVEVERRLRRYYEILAGILTDQPAVLREILLVGPNAPGPVGEELAGFLDLMRKHIGELIARHQGRGIFRRADPDLAAAALVGMVLGATRYAADLGEAFDPGSWAREMARMETAALVRPSAQKSRR